MAAQKFIQTLHSIGYPNAHELSPHDIEWAFENPATLQFMQWFSNGIGADNVLSDDELRQFKKIEESGATLEGSQLEQALESADQANPHSESLESEVEKLKISLKQAQTKKQILTSRRNKLGVHQVGLQNKVAKMCEVEEIGKRQAKQVIDKIAMQSVKVNQALEDLSSHIERLGDLYKPDPTNKTGPTVASHFLSQLDLKTFQDAEAKYSQDLTAFTKKQFFEGVAQMSGEGESVEYSLLDLKSPHADDLTGEDSEKLQHFLGDCEKLQRLREIFPQSECNRINALINVKKAHAAVNEASSLLESLKSGQFPSTLGNVSQLRKSLDSHIENAIREADPLLANLPSLVKELGSLQGGQVLTGDYDLKLRRQDHFTSKQDQVIAHLVSQRSRAEFLSLLYDLELRCHKQTHVLLSAARQVLSSQHMAWQQRKNALDDPDLTQQKFQGSVVDARDTSTINLFHLLGESEADKGLLCVRKQKVVEKAKHLHAQHTCAKASHQTMAEKHFKKVEQLEQCVSACESQLYTGCSTKRGPPMLSTVEVQAGITSLNASIDSLQTEITTITKNVMEKKQQLKLNDLLRKEREMFVVFHANSNSAQCVKEGLANQ